MAKRFTDTDKWKDEWYTELTNDYKVIWLYLLDNCDNAGLYKRNIKLLNYYCNTNVSAEDILKVFTKRVTQLTDDKWLINKFCIYQYGTDFLDSTNKAVLSAVKLLEQNNIIKWTGKLIDYNYGKTEIRQRKEYMVLLDYTNPIDTQSIPNEYHIDTPKEQVKEQVKYKIIKQVIETEKDRLEANKRLNQIVDIKEKNDWVLAKTKLNELVDDYGSLEYVVQSVFNDSNIENKYIKDLSQLNII
jgi:hypothetical protein